MKTNQYALNLVKTAKFHEIEFKFFTDGQDLWVTQLHLGVALEYKDPLHGIVSICCSRWPETFAPLTQIFKLSQVEGFFLEKRLKMRFFNSLGMIEICRHSRQLRATELMHWLHKQVTNWRDSLPTKAKAAEILHLEPVKPHEQELSIIGTMNFEGLPCNFYSNNSDIWLTREQIGYALGYSEPRKAISDIHRRHPDRMDKFSTVGSLLTVEGGRSVEREVILYNPKGIYEICRWSRQPKADAFFDWVYDVLENLRQGRLAPKPPDRTEKLAAALKEVLTPAEAAKLAAAFTN